MIGRIDVCRVSVVKILLQPVRKKGGVIYMRLLNNNNNKGEVGQKKRKEKGRNS
jgi:hypothetical protein